MRQRETMLAGKQDWDECIYRSMFLMVSQALGNIKNCPTLFSDTPLLQRVPGTKAALPPKKKKKTATYRQQECTQWFIHSFKRTRNLVSISVPISLCIRCTAEQRDLVRLSSLIFLLVFCVCFHSPFPSLLVIFLIIWRPRSWLIEI